MLSATADADFDGSLLQATRSRYETAIAAHGADEDVTAVVTTFRTAAG